MGISLSGISQYSTCSALNQVSNIQGSYLDTRLKMTSPRGDKCANELFSITLGQDVLDSFTRLHR